MTAPTRDPGRRPRVGRTITTIALVLAVIGGAGAWFAFGSAPDAEARYATATVSRGDITETWTTSGPVTRSLAVTATFGTTGTVTGVAVTVGQEVEAGQVLATLDDTQLALAVTEARAELAKARAQLAIDEASDSSGSGGSPADATASQLAALQAQVTALEAQVASAQASAASALQRAAGSEADAAAARQQLAEARAQSDAAAAAQGKLLSGLTRALASDACVATFSPRADPLGRTSPSAEPTPSASAEPTPSASAEPTPSATASPSATPSAPAREASDDAAACRALLASLVTRPAPPTASPSASQNRTPPAASAPSAAPATRPQAAGSTTGQGSDVRETAGGAAASGASLEVRLAQDRAAILQAEQDLDSARRSLAEASLTSPVSGRVGAMSLELGLSSASRSVTIVSGAGAEIIVQVPLGLRPHVSVGQSVAASLPSASASVTGQVTRIAALATDGTEAETPTYAVTIVADDPNGVLPSGTVASVVVDLAERAGVTRVPASAVTPTGAGTGTVQVLASASGTPVETKVTTGAIGGGYVEVASGVEAGQRVVLATMDLPIPDGSAGR